MIDWKTIKYSNKASRLAYNKSNHITKINKLASHTCYKTDSYAYTWVNNKSLYISFRGTEKLNDLVFNVDIRQYKHNNDIAIHNGFWTKYKALKNSIKNTIDDITSKTTIENVTCTGHSMGGALASICACDLAQDYDNLDMNLYTFGSPRVGNIDFAHWCSASVSNHYRLANKGDIITYLPFSPQYNHIIGNGILFDDTGEFGNYEIQWVNNESNNIKHIVDILTKYDVNILNYNHSCNTYLKHIQAQFN